MTATRSDGRLRVAYNEGATPRVTYKGRLYDNPFTRDRIVDADDLESAVQSDGERGVLLCRAASEGCRIIGEDDTAIMRSGKFASEALLKYLVARQITNYFLAPRKDRNPLEDYLDETVLKQYGYGADINAEQYEWRVADAMDYVDSSLAAANLRVDDEAAVMQHFKEQSLVQSIVTRLQSHVPNDVQEVALAYNHLRDVALVERLFNDWGEANAPHKVAVFGMPHLHAVVRGARDREVTDGLTYEKYLWVARGIGQSLTWWHPEGGRQVELSNGVVRR